MKTAVITGAASGIGRELVIKFLASGFQVAAADMDANGLQSLGEDLASDKLMTHELNVTDAEAFVAFSAAVSKRFGGADVLINNAGITRVGDFLETSPEAFSSVMDVNFMGVVNGSRAFMPLLKASKGVLVNISSLFGLVGIPKQSAYCASKFAVKGFSEALRLEVLKDGVHVATVHPGGVSTSIAKNAVFDAQDMDKAKAVKSMEKNALKLSPVTAAEIIFKGFESRRNRIIVGKDAKLLDRIQRLFPNLYPKIISYTMGKSIGE